MNFDKTNNPETERSELTAMKPIYKLIRDCIAGEYTIKKAREEYLPRPNPLDTSDENLRRYEDYLTRAVFYNVTGETNEGFQGQLQLKPPVIVVPELIGAMKTNADGKGLSLAQIIKDAAQSIVPYGRGGWVADFPAVGRGITRQELADGTYMPTVRFVQPWDIINWEERFVGNKKVLTMAVVREYMEIREKDSLEVKHYKRYRVMLLEGKNFDRAVTYLISVDKPGSGDTKTAREFGNHGFEWQKFAVNDADGKPMTKLPFEFVGSDNNDSKIDQPPLYTMATMNIAHYRNSADYEESVYICGQPTPWATGLTKDWVTDVLKNKFRMGSRSLITLPIDADVGLLQADPNTLAEGAMINKQEQMMMAGAKLVRENSKVERKQAEIQAEGSAQTSKLSKIATNIETSLIEILKTAYSFISTEETTKETLNIEINKVFNIGSKTAEEIRVLSELANAESPAVARTEVRGALRLGGWAEMDDEAAFAEIDKDLEARTARSLANQPRTVGTI